MDRDSFLLLYKKKMLYKNIIFERISFKNETTDYRIESM